MGGEIQVFERTGRRRGVGGRNKLYFEIDGVCTELVVDDTQSIHKAVMAHRQAVELTSHLGSRGIIEQQFPPVTG